MEKKAMVTVISLYVLSKYTPLWWRWNERSILSEEVSITSMNRMLHTHGHPNVQLKFSSDKEMTSFIVMDDAWRADTHKSSKHSIKLTGFQICHIQKDLEACQVWTNLNTNFLTWNVHLIFCSGGIFYVRLIFGSGGIFYVRLIFCSGGIFLFLAEHKRTCSKPIKIKRNICSQIFFLKRSHWHYCVRVDR